MKYLTWVLSVSLAIMLQLVGCTAFQRGVDQAQFESAVKSIGYDPIRTTTQFLDASPGTIIVSGSASVVCDWTEVLRATPRIATASYVPADIQKAIIGRVRSDVTVEPINLSGISFRQTDVSVGSFKKASIDIATLIGDKASVASECTSGIKQLTASHKELVVITEVLTAQVISQYTVQPGKAPTPASLEVNNLTPLFPPGSEIVLIPPDRFSVSRSLAIGTKSVPISTLWWPSPAAHQ